MAILKLEMVEGNTDIVYHNTYPTIILAAGTADNLKELGTAKEKYLVISPSETISIKEFLEKRN